MKTKLLFLFTLISSALSSQTIHDFDWANDGSSNNQQITIRVGDMVRWTWGPGTHNLRAISGTESFNSGYHTGPGYVFSHTFNQIGSTDYVCDPHSGNQYGTVTVTATSSVEDRNKLNFSVYPNPASDRVTIQLPTTSVKSELVIYDYTGRKVKSNLSIENNTSIDVSNLSSGIYIFRVISSDKVGIQHFIKK